MGDVPGEITELLNLPGGEAMTGDRLWELVYPELRRRARAICQGERSDHTLSATAVVNEAYVRLSSREPHEWNDRSHFYAVAASIMRHVLIDHARARAAGKRGGGARKQPLEEAMFPDVSNDEEGLVAASEALDRLAKENERAALVVTLRVFGGLSIPDIAREVGVSERTVKSDWQQARERLTELL
ncbi:MAG: sigma-70 family RNA polymerase sigma factor [Deltaproteobacteria bacterium]|nr:sigma-70 family RNA polymerase sigma factor [Deltaproteobacteria bacterium]MBW2697520.1 sigma-70 family RNA polymerase sigma factor [Deltaproteobacteria bacterium]